MTDIDEPEPTAEQAVERMFVAMERWKASATRFAAGAQSDADLEERTRLLGEFDRAVHLAEGFQHRREILAALDRVHRETKDLRL